MAAFNNNQHTHFFENNPQMGLPNPARVRLANEGLATVDDFADFKPDQIKDAIKNLRTAIPGVPGMAAIMNPDGTVGVPAVAPIPGVPACIISARCALRLKVASIAYHYYIDTDRTPTPQHMNYTNVLRGFYVEWEAIVKQSNEDKPKVPVLSRSQTPVRWIESFKDCLFRTFGVRTCPLAYVIRPEIAVPPEAQHPLQPGLAYSVDSGSVLQEMITRYSHNHALYRTDNNMVYSLLDEATRGTTYAPTIKPYARTKNGRAAWLAIVGSHAGDDKWESIQKAQMKFLINNKWNGRQFGLDKFTNLHRTAFVQLQEAAIHVNFQLPNEHSRVGYLLDNITNSDADLRAALASIRADVNGMRDNFKAAVTFMLPVCPYTKHSKNRNSGNAMISDATLLGQSDSKTGVDLRWHTNAEYQKLTKEQRQELYQWQHTKQGKAAMKSSRDKGKGGAGKDKKDINRWSKKQLKAKIAALQKDNENKEGGGEDGSSSSSKQVTFTLDDVKGFISAAAIGRSELNGDSEKRKASEGGGDAFAAAALHLQKIMKRN